MDDISVPKLTDEAVFTINGTVYRTGPDIPVYTTLSTYLRNEASLPGTKAVCKEGSCGSCVVNLKYTDKVLKQQVTVAVNSCLLPVLACHGAAITTVEGLGSRAKGYNKIQTTLAHFNGTQCGYCSPGFVMSMFSLLDSNPNATVEDVENNFSGNLCRCTGYRPILDAFKSLASNPPTRLKQKLLEIEESHVLCPYRKQCNESGEEERCKSCMNNIDKDLFELDFSELNLSENSFHLIGANKQEWYRPVNLKEIFEIFDKIGERNYILLAGNTARGVKTPEVEPDIYIDVNNVNDLKGYSMTNSHLTFGSLTRLNEFIDRLRSAGKNKPNAYGYAQQMADHMSLVANVPIRNRATVGGNLGLTNMNKAFPSDVFLLLDAVGATVTIARLSLLTRNVSTSELRSMDLHKRVITKVSLPAYNSSTVLKSYKIMPVSLNAVAIVNAAFLYDVDKDGKLNRKPSVVLSGINNTFRHANNTENYLSGKNIFNADVLKIAVSTLWSELKPDDVLPLFTSEYRKLLGTALFYKSVLSLAGDRADAKLRSGGSNLVRPISSGKQIFQSDEKEYPLTKPIPKIEAQIQCAGEAQYIPDMPMLKQELVGRLVLATKFADFESIDASKVLKWPGVVAFYAAHDIPGINNVSIPYINYFHGNFELFCSGTVRYNGQPVGVIIATTEDIANMAAEQIEIKYKAPKKPLISIRDVLKSPDKDKRVTFQTSQKATKPGVGGIHEISGVIDVTTGGQYAHSLETQSCRVVPEEDGQFKAYVSTQTLTMTKASISQVMGIPSNKVDCIVPRVGGSFGSKNTSQLHSACACTLAASKLQKPVRMLLPLSPDMDSTGKRGPYYATYKGKCDAKGKIQGLDIDVYLDYGFEKIMDLFVPVLACVVNYYDPSTWNINVYDVYTDKTPMLILRAPGFMESTSIIEQIMDHVAFASKLDPVDVRLINSADSIISSYITDWRKQTEYDSRLQTIDKFNNENRWKKKGIALSAMRYPISYIGYQIGCSVGILYTDGTVQVQHGGIDMGQGLNTKVAQAVAHELNIPLSSIQMKPSTSLNCPNNSPTSSSVGSELTVLAAVQCCEIINAALEPVKKENPEANWKEIVNKAYNNRISLSATVPFGVYPDDKKFGVYSVYGVAVTETDIDVLTGQYQITRVDILEDVGKSLSPEVDVGQVEGAFVMSLGLHTTERLIYDPNTAALLTDRLWFYHVPRSKDIPIDFRITFIPNATNPYGTLNSKATAEPAMSLGVSAINSMRYALMSARSDAGLASTWFAMESPSTPETILLRSGTAKEQFIL